MKKVLSLVLVIAMVLSSMSFAFAAKFEDVTGDYEKAINALAGLGIITGYEDGTYRPENTITRAEVAKLLVEILGYGDLVAGAKSNFSDTQGHWADAWIAIAAGRNIVIGTGDGKFTPDRQVTYDEVLTMIVRGLGYTDDSNEIKSMTWPTNFKVKAAEIGVTDGVKMSSTGADRGGVAQALFNALDATLVTVDTDGNVKELQDSKQKYQKLITRIAIEVGTEDSPLRIEPKHLDKDNKAYAGDIVDLAPYLYEYVEAYASKTDKDTIVYVGDSFSKTVKGTFVANHPSSTNSTPNYLIDVELEDESTETLDLTTTNGRIEVYYNGKEVKLNELELEQGIRNEVVGLDGTEVAEVKVVLKDREYDDVSSSEAGDVKAIVVENPTFAQKVVGEYKKDSVKLGRIQLPKKGDKVDLSKVTVTGAVDDIEDIQANDIVVAYAAGGVDNNVVPSKVELVVVRDTVEGTVTKVNKGDAADVTAIYIDGVKYTRSEIPGRTETFNVGYEGTFFLDNSGRLFAADATDISSAQDYAVVIEATDGVKYTNGVTLADPKIKLMNAAGEVVTYKVDKDAVYEGTSNTVVDSALEFQGALVNADAKGSKALIQYKLDGDVIDTIKVVRENVLASGGQGAKSNVDTDSSKFEIAKEAPIFNVKTGTGLDYTDKDNYSVVDIDSLPTSIDIVYAAYTDSGAYKVIVSTNADRSISGTFALITGVNYVKDGTKTVAEIAAQVDGKSVTYTSKDTLTVSSSRINKGVITELELTGGKVKSIVDPSAKATSVVTPSAFDVRSASIARINLRSIDDSSIEVEEELDLDNLVVYVLKSDSKFDYVEENVRNIAGFEVVGLYDIDLDGDIDIVVVK